MSDDGVHVFDCDGVILDSNESKLFALKATLTYLGCPKSFIIWAVEEFRCNFGRTRTAHFQVFTKYRCSSGFILDESLRNNFLDYYGRKVRELYASCPIIDETYLFLTQRSVNVVYVVSASDQGELRELLPLRVNGIDPQKIYGGPTQKFQNIIEVADLVEAKNITFYGDSVQDAKAAIQAGVTFIGLYKYSADPDSLKYFCKQNNLLIFKSCLEINL